MLRFSALVRLSYTLIGSRAFALGLAAGSVRIIRFFRSRTSRARVTPEAGHTGKRSPLARETVRAAPVVFPGFSSTSGGQVYSLESIGALAGILAQWAILGAVIYLRVLPGIAEARRCRWALFVSFVSFVPTNGRKQATVSQRDSPTRG